MEATLIICSFCLLTAFFLAAVVKSRHSAARRLRRAERGRLWPRWMVPIQLRLVRGKPDRKPDVILTRDECAMWAVLLKVLNSEAGTEQAAVMEWAAEQAMKEDAE